MNMKKPQRTTAFIHECEGIDDADEALLVMGERASEKS
jgi:hypothetical protein